jgi:hypothetical protein
MNGSEFTPLTGGAGVRVGVSIFVLTDIVGDGVKVTMIGSTVIEADDGGVRVPDGVASVESPNTCSPLLIIVKSRVNVIALLLLSMVTAVMVYLPGGIDPCVDTVHFPSSDTMARLEKGRLVLRVTNTSALGIPYPFIRGAVPGITAFGKGKRIDTSREPGDDVFSWSCAASTR